MGLGAVGELPEDAVADAGVGVGDLVEEGEGVVGVGGEGGDDELEEVRGGAVEADAEDLGVDLLELGESGSGLQIVMDAVWGLVEREGREGF